MEGRDYTRYRGEVRLALTTAESVLSFVLAAVIFIAFLAYVTISDLIQWRTLGKEKEEERGQWPPPCPLCDGNRFTKTPSGGVMIRNLCDGIGYIRSSEEYIYQSIYKDGT